MATALEVRLAFYEIEFHITALPAAASSRILVTHVSNAFYPRIQFKPLASSFSLLRCETRPSNSVCQV